MTISSCCSCMAPKLCQCGGVEVSLASKTACRCSRLYLCGLPWEVFGEKLRRGNHVIFVSFILVLQNQRDASHADHTCGLRQQWVIVFPKLIWNSLESL